MKTLQELHKEISANKDLQKAYAAAIENDAVLDFVKANGCDVTEDDIKEYISGIKKDDDTPLSVEDIENVSGGGLICKTVSVYKKMSKMAKKKGLIPDWYPC
ncbi:nif11-like leader peptide domain-containing protein [Butyrivibrio proteoclasticus]|uniref:Nif11-like leader peptide domain-containing protein n=1 Tax=Butyrivibrio proteoclasticus TaxID=43305 RepID=A0A1I5XBI1_9FIRM|nr:Nif11-like leader peptide family RiPP precursor [Butyrivibrio proteoclasticus]SFQ29328.1 nif11-like leader peptide domain-containing protein [Butyrivibrio proteoclasticus]